MSSRNDSSTSWVSLNRKTVGLLSTPAKRYSLLMSECKDREKLPLNCSWLKRAGGRESLYKVSHCTKWVHGCSNFVLNFPCFNFQEVGQRNALPFLLKTLSCDSDVLDLTFSKLLLAVLLGDFHLEYLVLTDGGGHLRQALSTGAPNTDQQHVAPELTDHTYHTGYWGVKHKNIAHFISFIRKFLIYSIVIIIIWMALPTGMLEMFWLHIRRLNC